MAVEQAELLELLQLLVRLILVAVVGAQEIITLTPPLEVLVLSLFIMLEHKKAQAEL